MLIIQQTKNLLTDNVGSVYRLFLKMGLFCFCLPCSSKNGSNCAATDIVLFGGTIMERGQADNNQQREPYCFIFLLVSIVYALWIIVSPN